MKLQFDARGADRKLSPNAVRSLFAGLNLELLKWRVEEMNAFKAQQLSGRPGLNRISGRLANSLVPTLTGDSNNPAVGFMFLPTMDGESGQMDTYASIGETGGVITPKNGKMLAWPVQGGPAATAAGVSRYGSSPRNYPGKLFFYQSHSGHKFLAESLGKKDEKLRLVYHLANSVTIPARLGFRTFATQALERVKMRLIERKVRILSEANA